MTEWQQAVIPMRKMGRVEDWYGDRPQPFESLRVKPEPLFMHSHLATRASREHEYPAFILFKRRRLESAESVEVNFRELKERWNRETRYLSSTVDIVMNMNYQQIIGLGMDVIPLILKDLEESRNLWFWALMAITRENPVEESDTGNVERMTAAWLAWGRDKGYI